MSDFKEIGQVEQMPHEINHFEWRIANFFAIYEDQTMNNIACCTSPLFSFADFSWQFFLWPKVSGNHVYFDLKCAQKNTAEQELPVDYSFGLKKLDGKVDRLINGHQIKGNSNDFGKFIMAKAELITRKAEFTSTKSLTVVCTMKSRIKTKPLKLKELDKLSENFKELFDNKETCDVTLKVKNKNYMAHKTVLIARSSVFAATFRHDTLEKQTSTITIKDCDPDSFQEFLEYLYCGKLESLSCRSAMNLYYTSDKYDVEDLKAFCVECLKQCLTTKNICEIVVFADNYEEAPLLSAIQDFFNKNTTDILITSDWERLVKKRFRLANKLLVEMTKLKR